MPESSEPLERDGSGRQDSENPDSISSGVTDRDIIRFLYHELRKSGYRYAITEQMSKAIERKLVEQKQTIDPLDLIPGISTALPDSLLLINLYAVVDTQDMRKAARECGLGGPECEYFKYQNMFKISLTVHKSNGKIKNVIDCKQIK